MATISSGQITIIDLHDAPSISAWISSTQTTNQTYHNTSATYNPNYTTTPLVLTLNLTKAGSSTSLIGTTGANISNIKWFKTVNNVKTEITSTATEDSTFKGGVKYNELSTKENVKKENNSIIWTAEGTWTDPTTQLPVEFSAKIDILLVQISKAAVIGNISAPNGDTFKNKKPDKVVINADLYKDGTKSADDKTIKWFAADQDVKTAQDVDAGVGWRKIVATTGATKEVANEGFDVLTKLNGVLTVYPDAVTNTQTYQAIITDQAGATPAQGGSKGTKVSLFLTIRDMDDPIMTVVESTGGSVLKNGLGSTTLKARVFRNGTEIDTGDTVYNYTWSKWENQVLTNFSGTSSPIKTGKTLYVGNVDVNITTTFRVEVSTK